MTWIDILYCLTIRPLEIFFEVPFFIAAYRFLSSLQLLQGVSFGPIADLGAPDALITIGGFTINVLPVLMTLVNVRDAANWSVVSEESVMPDGSD